jgi:LPXTG-motif cell wall-anchored protein
MIHRPPRLRGYGHYELAGIAEREASPYLSLGEEPRAAMSQPFDLNAPGVPLEIKQALVALARVDADPLTAQGDPIRETVWQELVLSGPYQDAWEGAAADEFVTAISRYAPASGIPGPYVRLGGGAGKYGIVGGAQPTAAGLEVLAGAIQTKLGGVPSMQRYLAWRGGVFAPPSTISGPPAGAAVLPIQRSGKFWDPTGYTPMWSGAPADIRQNVERLDESLISCIQSQVTLQTEEQRLIGINDCLRSVRAARHQLVLLANKDAPLPECPDGSHYDRSAARCVPNTPIDLPPVDIPIPGTEECVADLIASGRSPEDAKALCTETAKTGSSPWLGIAVGAGLGLGAYYLWKRRERR